MLTVANTRSSLSSRGEDMGSDGVRARLSI